MMVTAIRGICFYCNSPGEATAIAAGVPTPLASRGWVCSFFIVFMMYVIGACLVTMVIVHVYNRRVLRKIKEMGPFGEQQANKSDS